MDIMEQIARDEKAARESWAKAGEHSLHFDDDHRTAYFMGFREALLYERTQTLEQLVLDGGAA